MKLHRQKGDLCLDVPKCSVSQDKESCLGYFLNYAMQVIGLDDHDPTLWAYVLGFVVAGPGTD